MGGLEVAPLADPDDVVMVDADLLPVLDGLLALYGFLWVATEVSLCYFWPAPSFQT